MAMAICFWHKITIQIMVFYVPLLGLGRYNTIIIKWPDSPLSPHSSLSCWSARQQSQVSAASGAICEILLIAKWWIITTYDIN